MSKWITAKEALDHVLQHELSPKVAQSELEGRFRDGSVPARMSCDGVEVFFFPDWSHRSFRINYDDGSGAAYCLNQLKPGRGGVSVYQPVEFAEFTSLEVSRAHLLKIWPEGSGHSEKSTTPSNRKGVGGAPTKYDWAAAAGALACFLTEYDFPSQGEAVKALSSWFDRAGHQPDKRDVERFVSAAYQEADRERELRAQKRLRKS